MRAQTSTRRLERNSRRVGKAVREGISGTGELRRGRGGPSVRRFGKSWTERYEKCDVNANVPSSKPTLEAIAAAAGVSAMTVSRALNGARGVSADLRRRLQALARKLGY